MTFALSEAVAEDIDALISVHIEAMQDDGIYSRMFRDVIPAQEQEFWRMVLKPRFARPYIKYFKITDTEAGALVAYTGLEYPHEVPTTPASHPSPRFPDGTQIELAQVFTGMLSRGLADRNGYDVRNDFHRRGTRTLPAYQGRGLASRLATHCAQIADHAGQRTFIIARPAAVRLCEKTGFKEVAQYEVDLGQYGGQGVDVSKLMIRQPAADRQR